MSVQNHASSVQGNGVPGALMGAESAWCLLTVTTSAGIKQSMNNLGDHRPRIKEERVIFLLATGKNPRTLPPVKSGFPTGSHEA